jgi:hypothetical protein
MFETVGNLLYLSKVDSTIKNMRGWQKYDKKSVRLVFGEVGRFEELMQGLVIMKSLKFTPEQAASVLMLVDNTDSTIKDGIISYIKSISTITGTNPDKTIAAVQAVPALVRLSSGPARSRRPPDRRHVGQVGPLRP